MTTQFQDPNDYVASLPEERQQPVAKLREVLKENLPNGFSETMSYGMISYVVPHSLYPPGYHVDRAQPLPFISLASQKNYIALYHMGLYAMPDLLNWFREKYPQHSRRKLDMGKSCIRFKKPGEIPYELVGELASKVSPEEWISIYEKSVKR